MKALSLWQPWASLIALGAKQWETRSWYMKHRGPLAIHAAQKWNGELFQMGAVLLYAAGSGLYQEPDRLPRGAVLCIVEPEICLPTEKAIKDGLISDAERMFGDYRPGRFCTRLKLVKVFETPIAARGGQLIWNWDDKGAAA
jgi:activating signal cointegrator 1